MTDDLKTAARQLIHFVHDEPGSLTDYERQSEELWENLRKAIGNAPLTFQEQIMANVMHAWGHDEPEFKVGDVATNNKGPLCAASEPRDGYGCTRTRGHFGQHVANGTTHVLAVWND